MSATSNYKRDQRSGRGRRGRRGGYRRVRQREENKIRSLIESGEMELQKHKNIVEASKDKNGAKGELGYRVIRQIEKNPEMLTLLKKILEENYFPKSQAASSNSWSNYNAVAWWGKDADQNLFNKVVKELHTKGFNIFKENGRNENALGSLFEATRHKKWALPTDEMERRYFVICNIVPEQVKRITSSVCNKIDKKIDGKQVDQLVFCLVNDHKTCIETLVRSLIVRRVPSMIKYDHFMVRYLELFLEAMKKYNDQYKTIELDFKDLELFFNTKMKDVAPTSTLYGLFVTKLVEIGFPTDGKDKKLDWETGAILLGELSRRGVIDQLYRQFVSSCVNRQPLRDDLQFVKSATKDELVRILVRVFTQRKKITSFELSALSHIYKTWNLQNKEIILILNYVENVTNSRNGKQILINFKTYNSSAQSSNTTTVKKEPLPPQVEPIDFGNPFAGWRKIGYETMWDDFEYSTEKLLNKKNFLREEYLEHLIFCISEEFTIKESETVEKLVEDIVMNNLFTEKEILQQFETMMKNYEMDLSNNAKQVVKTVQKTALKF